jgi:hypothetical protein
MQQIGVAMKPGLSLNRRFLKQSFVNAQGEFCSSVGHDVHRAPAHRKSSIVHELSGERRNQQ